MATSEHRNPDRDTWGRRCELGCESWPDNVAFSKCLRCGGETTRYSNLQPISLEEGTQLLRQAQFNAFYAKWCAERQIPPAGPLPAWYEDSLGPLPRRLLEASPPSIRA